MATELPMPSAATDQLIQALGLQAHPEGGFYKETWRSSLILPQGVLPNGYDGDRSAGTSILFLLPTGHSSRWHRVKSAELWFHQAGDPLELRIVEILDQENTLIFLGQDNFFQSIVPPNWWQRAQPVAGSAGYSLVSCVVVPGFDFADFEIIIRDEIYKVITKLELLATHQRLVRISSLTSRTAIGLAKAAAKRSIPLMQLNR